MIFCFFFLDTPVNVYLINLCLNCSCVMFIFGHKVVVLAQKIFAFFYLFIFNLGQNDYWT